ncbi:MAG: hypothetical protein QM723_40575 [Myxococcaceae bacterium]
MLTKASAGIRKRQDARCAAERASGKMSAAPEPAEARALASRVFLQAFEDLHGDVDDRDDALEFLRVTAWTGETPWAALLGLRRGDVLAKVDQILRSPASRDVVSLENAA